MSFQNHFPPELLLAIFGELASDKDLLRLAATCRRFNHLSLQVLFSNHNIDPNSKTIIVQAYAGAPENIPAAFTMSLALRRTSLEHLSFDFGLIHGSERLLHRIHTLTRYIINLSTIDRVTFHLAIPSYCPVATDWEAAYVTLLDTVIGKSCSNLCVRIPHCWEDRNILSISNTPSWIGIPARLSETVKKLNGEAKHLKDCLIEDFPSFLRPFYLRVLKVNAPVLTGLVFRSVFGPGTAIDWEFLITNIHLPVLKRFAISFGNIPQDAIIKFLSKHPHLTNFECHNIQYTAEPKDVPCELKDVFTHLEQVTTTPEYILTLLPTMDRMPCLTFVAIIIEDGHMDFSVFEQALRRLSSCVKKIELTIDLSFALGAFLKQVYVRSYFWRENDFMLQCVESLRIRWGWRYTAADLGQIPVWLKRFSQLTKLTLSEHSSGCLMVERNAIPPFLEQVKLACPAIASISLPEWNL